MNAAEKIREMLKTLYEDGDVNAMQVWKGYDVSTGRTGWHYRWFGRSEAHCMGNSVAEAAEYVADEANLREVAP